MNDREEWRERVRDIRAASTIWWWWFSLWSHTPELKEVKWIFDMKCYGSLRMVKTWLKQQRKFLWPRCYCWPSSPKLVFKSSFWWYVILRGALSRIHIRCRSSCFMRIGRMQSVQSTRELTLDFNASLSTISCHLKKIGKVTKLGVWVSHNLNEKHKEDYKSIATSLLSRQRIYLFFKNITTSDKNGSSIISWIAMTRKSGKHCVWHMEPLDSCFDFIRSHRQNVPWSPPLKIEPATTECWAKTLLLSYWSTPHTSDAK